jgi:DNA-binding MarR family transcriptional regulator
MPTKTQIAVDLEPINMLVLKKLRVIIQAAHNHSDSIRKKCGIGGTQLWLLQEISDSPSIRVGVLAKKVSLKSTTVSNLIDDLEVQSLINKKRAANDQRVVLLELTEKGAQLLKTAPKPTKGLLPHSLECMKKSELTKLANSLDLLINSISHYDEKLGSTPLPFNV